MTIYKLLDISGLNPRWERRNLFMLGFFFFTSTPCLKGKLNSHQRCTTNSGDDILGALGCQWHFSGQFEQSFVCSNWCLQKVLIFQTKNVGIPCLGMLSRACLGVSPGVSACLGHVSACLGVSRRVWGMVSTGVFGVSRGWCRGQKNMILSYLIRHNKTDYRSGNNKKADYFSEKKNLSYSFMFHKKKWITSQRTKKSGLPLREHKKKRTTARKTKKHNQKKNLPL